MNHQTVVRHSCFNPPKFQFSFLPSGKLWQILNDFGKELSSQHSNSCGIFSYIHNLLETDDNLGDLARVSEVCSVGERSSSELPDDEFQSSQTFLLN